MRGFLDLLSFLYGLCTPAPPDPLPPPPDTDPEGGPHTDPSG